MPLDQIDVDNYNTEEKEMTFLDHLEEFRWALVRSIAGIFVSTSLVFAFKKFFIDFLMMGPSTKEFIGYKFLCAISNKIGVGDTICFHNEVSLFNPKVSGEFMGHLTISVILGLILSLPWIFWQIWLFIKPALYKGEQKAMRGIIFFLWLLFIMGSLFGYLIILPFSLNFFINYKISENVMSLYSLKDYLNYITMSILSGGIMFEMPILLFVLSKLGLVNPNDLKPYRRHAILIIIILASIITPPDVISQILIAIPVYLMYEISIHVSAWTLKRQKAKAEKEKINNQKENLI